jgi:RHS repeat-associated protein
MKNENFANSDKYFYIDDVSLTQGNYEKVGQTDYYPGGMTMPNRNVQGDYRYAYQGQEKDPETGKEAFQLRLYDSRINRWLTTDPAGQYHSPYLSMSNNWISVVDPDGGCDDGQGNLIACPEDGGGMAHQLNEMTITQKGVTNSGFAEMRFRQWESIENNFIHNRFEMGKGAAAISIGLPALIIGGLEAGAYLGTKSLFSFSAEGLGARVGFETGSEILANGGDLTKVNLAGIGASAFTGLGSEVTGSFLRYTYEDGFKIESFDAAVVNFGVGRINRSIHGGLGKASNFLGNQGAVLGMRYSLDFAGQTGTKLLGGELSK